MGFESILVLGAHPDDEMGCSGTLARLIGEGADVRAITFSRCQDLNGPELIAEWREAVRELGVNDAQLLDLPNRRLPEHRQEILEVLDAHRGLYDLVLCPSTRDVHQDHATIAEAARRVFKKTTVLGYELPLNHVGASEHQAYIRLSRADVEAKVRHVQAYQSQRDEAYMAPDYVIALARVRGVQAETEFAEAFEVIRWVV